MADRYLPAFLKNAVGDASEEITALENLLYQRLLAGNFQINSAGVVTFSFSGLFGDGLVGTPSISFVSEPTTGRYRIGAGNVGESILGNKVFEWSATAVTVAPTITLRWSDIVLRRSAAKTLTIDTDGAGGALTLVDVKGPLTASGLITGNNVTSTGTTGFTAAAGTVFLIAGRSMGGSPADGLWQFTNNAQTTFTRLILGANDATVNGASWNLNAGVLEAKTGDATAFTAIKGTTLTATTALSMPGTSGGVLAFTGASTLASSGALTQFGVVVGGGAGAVPQVTPAGTTGQVLVATTSANPAFANAAASGASLVLLKANSGTDTAAGATNVDTIAISGLTAKDTLLVYYSAISVTQQTADLALYSVTDSQLLAGTMCGVIAAAEVVSFDCKVMQSQASSTSYWTFKVGGGTVAGAKGPLPVISPAMTTAFTGAWTLALRHGGVTAGGTLQWKWAVYAVKGQ